MKKVFLALALGAMMMTACDKVDEYTTDAGAIGEWSDGTSVADKSQRAFVEKYTGAKCVMCPAGDKVLEEAHETYGDKLIAVAIDGPGSLGEPYNGEPNTHTLSGDSWATEFGITVLPTAIINREKANGQWNLITTMSNVPQAIETAVGVDPKIALEVKSTLSGESTNIDVNIEYLQAVTEPLTLTLLVIEDSIISKQLTPAGIDKQYAHNHVLRETITDLWGTDIDAKGAQGECRKATFKYHWAETQVEPAMKLENCRVVAFVSYKESRSILNAASCKL